MYDKKKNTTAPVRPCVSAAVHEPRRLCRYVSWLDSAGKDDERRCGENINTHVEQNKREQRKSWGEMCRNRL